MVSTVVLLQHGAKAMDHVDPGLTERGREQVRRVASVLAQHQPGLLVSSPALRARQSLAPLSRATKQSVVIDDRARERMDYDPQVWGSFPAFLQDWDRATVDRSFVPAAGDSSHEAAARLRTAVADHAQAAELVVVATHGGVTLDLLRTLLGDHGVHPRLLHTGMPNGHLTTLLIHSDAIDVVGIGVDPQAWSAPTAT